MADETPRTAADVLREHQGQGEFCDGCGAMPAPRPGVPDRNWIARHQADMLAAAGLLVTAEHDAQVLRDAAFDHRPACAASLFARADRIAAGAQP